MNTGEQQPTCYIIAGPNGAGKTTFALSYLPEVANCRNFVNADMIASGLSPLSPEKERIAASRLFLREIKQYIARRQTFSFETTLSGRTYLRLIKQLKQTGWNITLFYLYLPRVEWSIKRVKERVAHGGHTIPEADIRRRFPRSLSNFLDHYAPLCDTTICFENSSVPEVVFIQNRDGREIINEPLYYHLLQEAYHGNNT